MVLSHPQGKQSMLDVGESIKDGRKIGSCKRPFKNMYHIGAKIASGSFGTVYRTHHRRHPDDIYAVKIVEDCIPGSCEEEEALHEAEIMRELNEIQHVIKLVDLYKHDNTMYIVQDLAEGGDVFDALSKREQYTEGDAWLLAKTLISTLGKIHECKIVHRDLKPENLLLRDKSRFGEVLVCDFGLAKKIVNDGKLISFCGSPPFVAPEIVERCQYDEKVDMWSIGCILYLLLSGQYPFGTEDDCDVLYQSICEGDFDFEDEAWDYVSGSAKRVISNLLKVEPGERWSADDAMNSNWIQRSRFAEEEEGEPSKKELQRSLKNIQLFCARRKVKAAIHAVKFSSGLHFSALNKARETESSSSSIHSELKTFKNANYSSSGKKLKHNLSMNNVVSFPSSLNTTPINPNEPEEHRVQSKKYISWQHPNTLTTTMDTSSSTKNKVNNIADLFSNFNKTSASLKPKSIKCSDDPAIASVEATTNDRSESRINKIRASTDIANKPVEVYIADLSDSSRNITRTSRRRIIEKNMDDLSEHSRNIIKENKRMFNKKEHKKKESKKKPDNIVEGSKEINNNNGNNTTAKRPAAAQPKEAQSDQATAFLVEPRKAQHQTSMFAIPELNSLTLQDSNYEIDESFISNRNSSVNTSEDSISYFEAFQDDDISNEDGTDSDNFFTCHSSSGFDSEQSCSIADLQNHKHRIEGVDYKNIEKYLTDEDFQNVFDGATREEVATWKQWKKLYYKKRSRIW